MRVLALAIALFALSGCASGGGLSPYLIQLSDLPPGCTYMDLSEGQGAEIREQAGLNSNPGKVDNDEFEGFAGNATVVDNMVALFECDGGEAISVALRFDQPDATTVFEEMGDCEGILVDGTAMTFFDLDGDIANEENAAKVIQGIKQRTGAVQPC